MWKVLEVGPDSLGREGPALGMRGKVTADQWSWAGGGQSSYQGPDGRQVVVDSTECGQLSGRPPSWGSGKLAINLMGSPRRLAWSPANLF